MGKQRREIDAAASDDFHQPAHAFFAAGTECCHYTLISEARGECFVRYLQLAGVDSETRKRSTGTQAP